MHLSPDPVTVYMAKEIITMNMIIRDETESDVKTISNVTRAAFENHPISNQTEHFIIEALRASNALAISLVAEVDGKVVGHIAFSPVTISDGSRNWYGIGPISVLPEYQKQGIGKALMQEGLARLRNRGAEGCVLVGDPNYDGRFGFKSLPELAHEGVPQETSYPCLLRETRLTVLWCFTLVSLPPHHKSKSDSYKTTTV
jgi:putative acetyltransferase